MAKREKHGKDVVWVKHDRKQFSKSERLFIFKRDGYKCQLCGKDSTALLNERVLDHKIPLSQLGSNRLTNIWLLCDECDKNKKSEILSCVLKERLAELQSKQLNLRAESRR
jgi:5-methylcytosine-specific restriction endonuclease McrA